MNFLGREPNLHQMFFISMGIGVVLVIGLIVLFGAVSWFMERRRS